MVEDRVHIIGYDEIVLLFGLIGIRGTILESYKDFKEEFYKLVNDSSISMLIIAIDLPKDNLDEVVQFKLNNRLPFVYVLPDIFDPNIDEEDQLMNKIIKSLGKII